MTDSTISALLQRHFLDPLSLERTYFPLEDGFIEPVAHPWGHIDVTSTETTDNWFLVSSNAWLSFKSGAFGTFATAEDLTRFVYTLLSGQLLTQASLDQMQNFFSFPWIPGQKGKEQSQLSG